MKQSIEEDSIRTFDALICWVMFWVYPQRSKPAVISTNGSVSGMGVYARTISVMERLPGEGQWVVPGSVSLQFIVIATSPGIPPG